MKRLRMKARQRGMGRYSDGKIGKGGLTPLTIP